MNEKKTQRGSSAKKRFESTPLTPRTEDETTTAAQLLTLPPRRKPLIDDYIVQVPQRIIDVTPAFSLPPIESQTQLLEKIRSQGCRVDFREGADLRRNLFVRRKEWLKIASSLKRQLPAEENRIEVPILPRINRVHLSRPSLPQDEPVIYPIPRHIVAPMTSTMWFDVENIHSYCKAYRKMNGVDIKLVLFEEHPYQPFDVVLSPSLHVDDGHPRNLQFIPEEQRNHINGIILPRKKRESFEAILPAIKVITTENLAGLKKHDLLRNKLEADIKLLTRTRMPLSPLPVDPVDILVKKAMAIAAIEPTCDFERSILPRRAPLAIVDMVPFLSFPMSFVSTDNDMKEVRKLRPFRRHEQSWWAPGPQEVMARCGHLSRLQPSEILDEIPWAIEIGEMDDEESIHFIIDLEERARKDMEILQEAIENFISRMDPEDEYEDNGGVAFCTREELYSLGFKFFPPDIITAEILQKNDSAITRETGGLMEMEQLEFEKCELNEQLTVELEDLQAELDFY